MKRWMQPWLLATVGLAACDDGGGATQTPQDAGPDAVVADARVPLADAGVRDTGSAPDMALPDASPPDASPPDAAPDAALIPPRPAPPAAGSLTAPRDWRYARGLIHMHSVHSHDACDGDPKPDGVPNATCLARFRAALCHNRFDYVLLTDHPGSFEDIPFEEAFLHMEGDTWVNGPEGTPIANYIQCPDNHRVLLMPGSEGDLTPVMFTRKPGPGQLRDASPEGVVALRASGALVFQAHTERFTAAELAPLDLDGIEIYNLHANLDPRGELRQLPEVLPDLIDWIRLGAAGPHPDLTYLTIFRENPRALAAFDGLSLDTELLAFAGSDIHENLPPLVRPADGDRIDSYRRLSSWFSNYVLVPEVTPEALRAALVARRLFVTFDLWGPPDRFDFHAEQPDGTVLEQGTVAAFAPGTRLKITPPVVPAGATIQVILWHITPDGPVEISRGSDAVDLEAPEPGPYRVEVRILPGHLRAELGDSADRFLREVVWIYSNPVYLR